MTKHSKQQIQKPTLDSYEQEIEDNIEKAKHFPSSAVKKRLAIAEQAARNYRKDKRITIRIRENDFERLKHLASEEGLPTQTFISSILHKLSIGRLIDRRHLEK